MMNESKKSDPKMWKKWKESGAVAMHPESYRLQQKAELKVSPPKMYHRNWMISFESNGRSEEWRDAYAWTIMDLANERGWSPFFQSGSQTQRENWQMIELFGCQEPDKLTDFLNEVQNAVEKKYPKLFIQ